MKFIDLFAGLGGFHVALEQLGHECVFASEINKDLRPLYYTNFGIRAAGDIRLVHEASIPNHDILCAGFPCQAFSKAGTQEGIEDTARGTLFGEIARIITYHHPKYIILENVANLEGHDGGRTWHKIEDTLTNLLGYTIQKRVLSPHQFGVPQIRQRVFIVGCRDGLDQFSWPIPSAEELPTLHDIIDQNPVSPKAIPPRELACLNVWQRFLDVLPTDCKLPSFPIWATEFGATYPFVEQTPWALPEGELKNYLGSFGNPIQGTTKEDQLAELPKYARFTTQTFPKWKQTYIRQNREFYIQYKHQIDTILPEIQALPFSWQKFEWNCQGGERNVMNYAIQFRPSGVRLRKTIYSSALVAFTPTQVPIWGWLGRYMTPSEGAALQSLSGLQLPEHTTKAFKALGNAVNAFVVLNIARNLISEDTIEEVCEAASLQQAEHEK